MARKVVQLAEGDEAKFQLLYEDDLPLEDKIRTIAQKIYGARDIALESKAKAYLDQLQEGGYGHLPVCMAKTQYSFSADATKIGAPENHVVPVREVRLSSGAGFVVVICGDIMTMPGLPRIPAANSIHLDENGLIQGLF